MCFPAVPAFASGGSPAGAASGACLEELDKTSTLAKARQVKGSAGDYSEILSTKSSKATILIRWRTLVVFANSTTKEVLKGSCVVSADGKKVLSISYK
jgi:hypothetical protein